MSEQALLHFGKVDEEFYTDKETAAEFVVNYDDASMETVELEQGEEEDQDGDMET